MLCENCPQKRTADLRSCGSRGPVAAPILIVGMAPGREELVQGIPFVGGSGKILMKAMLSVGLKPDRARFINVINCYPLGKGDKITPEQFVACASRFAAECEVSSARTVLALGADALLRTTGLKGQIARWRGHLVTAAEMLPIKLRVERKAVKIQPAIPPDCNLVIPSLHPAFIMRQGLRPLPFLFADVERAKRSLNGGLRPLVLTRTGLDDVLDDVGGPLCIDLEAEINGAITQVGLGRADRCGTFTPSILKDPRLLCALESPVRLKIGHNLAYDIGKLAEVSIEVRGPLWDTMWAGQMIHPDLDKNLDTMSSLFLDVPRWKHLRTSDADHYNLMDVATTQALVEPQREALVESKQLEVFERTMRCLPILIAMTRAGVRIDQSRREELASVLSTRLDASQTRFRTLAGEAGFADCNPAYPIQLKKLLYETLGLPPKYSRATGSLTTDKYALQDLRKRSVGMAREILGVLLDIRETGKLLSVYLNVGDRVHPSYFPVGKDDAVYGTATGRLSAQNPNIQNQPKLMRVMFIPEDGFAFVVGDFSQLELRITAALAGEKQLIQLFDRGRDPFDEIQARFVKGGGPTIDRTRIKNLVYGGGVYGGGWRTLLETLLGRGYEIEGAEIRRFLDWFFKSFPAIKAWQADVVATAVRDGFAENRFGRRRAFYDPTADVPAVINFHPQSTAADIVWDLMPEVDELSRKVGAGRPITAIVHDEFVIQARIADAEHVALYLQKLMQREWPQVAPGFRVPAKVSIGKSWGELTEVPDVR